MQARKLSDILPRGENNFDLIRLVAALTVIFGHSFYLFPTGGFREPVTQLVERNFSGTLAVGTFFFISGILISQSFGHSKSPLRYATLRVARIYPGLIACLLITVFVLGPIITTMPASQYFKHDWTYCYLLDNWSLTSLFQSCQLLPGVFVDNHFGAIPNGSLWTLKPEVVCYLYIFIFGCLGCLKSSTRILVTITGLLLLHASAPRFLPYFSDDHYTDVLKVSLFFMAGVAAYALRARLVLRMRYAIPLIIVAVFLQKTAVQEYALYCALFYIVLVAAASVSLQNLKLPGDYSFGIYIYGWPIQQLVQHFLPGLTSYPSNLICLPLAVLAGYGSWTLIERPALSKAQNLTSKLQPASKFFERPA